MISFVKAYPYLFASLGGGVIVLTVGRVLLSRPHMRIMTLSGLLSVPCFPFLLFLEKEYWIPVRWGGWILGIEDAVCSFWVAAVAWIVVAMPLRDRIRIDAPVRVLWSRYLLAAGMSVSFFLLFFILGFGGMGSLLLAYLIVTPFLLLRIRKPWPLLLAGMILYPALYSFQVKCIFWFWPECIDQWNTRASWGSPLWGIPRGEITWSFVFGAYWPLLIAYVFDLSMNRGYPVDLGAAEKNRSLSKTAGVEMRS